RNTRNGVALSLNLITQQSHRNLVTRGFWRVTGADVKGGEKLANPELYLKEFLAKCEYWQVMLDTQTK
ncbi:hypothetical protein AB6C94_20705, partial [Vibrio splendidus]